MPLLNTHNVAWLKLALAVIMATALAACDDGPGAAPANADADGAADAANDVPPADLTPDTGSDPDLTEEEDTLPDAPAEADSELPDALPDEEVGPTGVTARFEALDGDDFYRLPWPFDARTLPGGHPDLSDFPGPQEDLVDDWIALIERDVIGFAAMPVVYIALTGPLDPASLPDAPTTLEADSPVQLIGLAPETCGQRVPIRVVFDPLETGFRPANVLMATPVPGFPLHPGVWGLIATTDLLDASGEPLVTAPGVAEALAGEHPEPAIQAAFDPLNDCLSELELDPSAIAVATIFTVQDARAELLAIREAVMDPSETAAPAVRDFAVDATASEAGQFTSWAGAYDTPIYQRGESPYTATGGGFVFDDQGEPEIQRWEAVPFLVTVPQGGPAPYPLMIWVDGTGASLRHHLGGAPMREALAAGLAVASFTPQFTDGRAVPGSDPSIHGFNWVNGEAGRTVFRQQAVDTSYFIRVLREALPADAGLPELDASRLIYGGQSQGSLIGAILAGVEPELRAFGLNGTGGYLGATVAERKDPVEYARLLRVLLGVSDEMDVFHPVIQLIQLGGEPVDPLSYTRAWSGWPEHPAGANLLLINGDLDPTTPRVLVDSMTVAGDLAPLAPPGWDVDPWGVWPREAEAPPLQGNRTALDSSPLTRVSVLAAGQGHFTIYDDVAVREQLVDFLVTASAGLPEVPVPSP